MDDLMSESLMNPGDDFPLDYDINEYIVPRGFEYIKYSLDIWLVLPLALILNLTLFIKLVRTPKIKDEPWRWLIGNTSFIILVMAFLLLNVIIAYKYRIPTLNSTLLCPALAVLQILFHFMYVISNFLVIIERFHALRLGKEDGGFGKKAVILCLSLFWIFVTIGLILSYIVEPLIYGHGLDISTTCFLNYSEIHSVMVFFIWLFTFPAFIVVFIGTLVMRHSKTTTSAMIASNVKPTLAASSLGLFLMMLNFTLDVLLVVRAPYLGQNVYLSFNTLGNLHLVVFPVIWLVTWAKNSDISFQCCKANDDEEKLLLQPK